ncbi:MAG: NAD-dependent succinate-semialdehyde dehydrogenase [Xanthomonadaceae bacterium]|nr:NAD-dependent succinate-semialdehyde dehydrogenase [Xanthomonadaceae bacterium]
MAFASINPASGKREAEFAAHDAAATEERLAAATAAAPDWATTPVAVRVAVLTRCAELLSERRETLAALATLEMGKLEREALAEVDKCGTAFSFYAQHAAAWLADEVISTDATRSLVARQPLGVVLAVMPWNFPFWQVVRFAAPALAAGNVGLLKHASNVPQCALALERLFADAGAPPGVFQTLLIESGDVARLIEDPRVRAVTLTGSESAGRAVATAAAGALKKSVLELGGSDAFVVLDDADLPRTLEVAVTARFQNAGQSCIAAKRFIVADAIHDAFVEGFAARAAALEPGRNLAPLARADLRDELHRQVVDSIAAGARCATGGEAVPGPGAYYRATVLYGVVPGMPAADEELFGPVAAVLRARDDAHALALANGSRFGLGASVWTQDAARGERFARAFESGLAFVNGMVKSDARLPFGGVKASGYGRELARDGLYEFVNTKSIWIA